MSNRCDKSMTVKKLATAWQKTASAKLANETYILNLALEDAARVDALAELYPRRTKEQLLSELVSAALAELEESLPYVAGSKVIALDESGDPIYEDVGPTPEFLALSREYLAKHQDAKTIC